MSKHFCSYATERKQNDLPRIYTTHIAQHIKRVGKQFPYLICEMNAGEGQTSVYREKTDTWEDVDGSPLVAYKAMTSAGLLNWHLFCFERNRQGKPYGEERRTYNALIQNIQKLDDPQHRIETFGEDNLHASDRLKAHGVHAQGLAYCDPSGYFQSEAIKRISTNYPQIDLLINVNCVVFKRRHVDIAAGINALRKKHWFIGSNKGGQQWYFFYGTNDPKSIEGIGNLLLPVDDNGLGQSRYLEAQQIKKK